MTKPGEKVAAPDLSSTIGAYCPNCEKLGDDCNCEVTASHGLIYMGVDGSLVLRPAEGDPREITIEHWEVSYQK